MGLRVCGEGKEKGEGVGKAFFDKGFVAHGRGTVVFLRILQAKLFFFFLSFFLFIYF